MKYAITILLIWMFSGFSFETANEGTATTTEIASDVIASMDEWKVPFDDTRTRDPYVAPDGTVFFAGQREHYVGHFNPETGDFRQLPLEDGAGPHTVIVAENGTVWYAGNRARHIGKMDPESGEVTKFMMDDDYARDPHTFAFDKDGNIWFTAQGGNGIGHFNVSTGEAKVIPVPVERARPYGIRMTPDRERPWISFMGTNHIATVDPESYELEMIELPREETITRRLDVTSDGNIWYGDFSGGQIGRYNPSTGDVTEWEMPDGDSSRPYAALKDHKDRMWFSASGLSPNKLVAFDTQSEEFVASQEIPSGEGSIRHMDYDERTQSLWFGTDTGHIGRLVLN